MIKENAVQFIFFLRNSSFLLYEEIFTSVQTVSSLWDVVRVDDLCFRYLILTEGHEAVHTTLNFSKLL